VDNARHRRVGIRHAAAVAEVGEVLARRGGSATLSDLLAVVTAHAIRSALGAGSIRRVAKGVYALPEAPPALTAARSQGGVVSHLSAAQHWRMNVIAVPPLPHVTLPPRRARRRAGLPCVLHWAEVPAIDDVTTPVRTVLDCVRTLPLSEALAVTDSALQLRLVDRDELVDAAARLVGPHRRRIQRVVELADRRAESVLESALRAILIEAGIKGFEPQVRVQDTSFSARLDLGHRQQRVGLEADGFEHHGTRTGLVKDCRRQVNLSLRGWLVLRFSWEDVMYDPEWVAEAVRGALQRPALINRLPTAA
jgi:very-short-patch-repair endonuclease